MGILKSCEKRLLAMTDMEKMVDFLRGEVARWPHDKLQVFLTFVSRVLPCSAEFLR